MKNIQENLKQLHGNICIFLHSIEQLNTQNETNLGIKNKNRNFFFFFFFFEF